MKILHVITLADLGGAQSVLIALCNQAADEGHEVFVASESDGPMWDLLHKNVQQIKISTLCRAVSIVKDLKTFLHLKAVSSRIKPDVIHLHSSKIGFLGRLAFPPAKLIYTVHGFDSIRLANRKFLFLEKILKSRSRFTVAVSNYDAKNLASEGINSNVEVIYNGVKDGRQLSENAADVTSVKKLLDLKKDHTVIMTVARLSPPKDFELFCDLADECLHDSKYHFVWIGNRADQEISKPNMTMLGELANAPLYMRYAEILLLPSKFEGLPVSILEGLSLGIPVVASDVGGISEVLDGENGFAVKNSPNEFKKAIEKILKDKTTYDHFSSNARNDFENFYTLHSMYTKYMKLYIKLWCGK